MMENNEKFNSAIDRLEYAISTIKGMRGRRRFEHDLSIAIALISKEIAKEPKEGRYHGHNITGGNPYKESLCGSCERLVRPKYNYCPQCGQKINWEVQE